MATETRHTTESESSQRNSSIAFLGSSSTAGRGQAFNWIRELKSRPQNNSYAFLNFGVGGDLAENTSRRLDELLTESPDLTVVWIGANDVLAMTFPKYCRLARRWKHLSEVPSPESFTRHITQMIHRLKTDAGSRVGLCSLAPIGEDLFATSPPQSTLNSHIERLNAIIRDVAVRLGAQYIPVNEAICAAMKNSPRHALSAFRLLPFYRDAFRAIVLRFSSEKIASLNGWQFHTDGIHLNRRGGMIVAEWVQAVISNAELSS